jgi:EpsI family protein
MATLRKKYWVIFGLLILAILGRYAINRGAGLPPDEVNLRNIPYQVDGWQGTDQALDEKVRQELGLDEYIQRRYVDQQGQSVWLYVGYYRQQRQGKGIHSPKHCYPGAGWSIMQKGLENISVSDQQKDPIRVNRILFQKEDAKQIVLYWYQSPDRIVHSEYAQRFYMVLDAIVTNRTDGALIKISAPVFGNLEDVIDYQKKFIQLIFPSLQKELSGHSYR